MNIKEINGLDVILSNLLSQMSTIQYKINDIYHRLQNINNPKVNESDLCWKEKFDGLKDIKIPVKPLLDAMRILHGTDLMGNPLDEENKE